ncbi:MAG TPA: stage II sporulation protein E [Leptospiraceae bacterium]|nr:stage II sporulation protein E [Spirochaetaceae bacterium]HBS03597.1 stage II sporulation protein E [Leptospiraceae bacterium]|tara:strand:+ start:29432 stop:32176 length:2745 start_codon:yes stop_codon:yes gene_type:complete
MNFHNLKSLFQISIAGKICRAFGLLLLFLCFIAPRLQGPLLAEEPIASETEESSGHWPIQKVYADRVNALDTVEPARAPNGSNRVDAIDTADQVNTQETAETAHTWWVTFSNPGSLQPEPVSSNGWHPVTVPGYLTDVPGYSDSVSEMWYLKRFRIEGDLEHSLSLRLGRIDDRDQVYVNGKPIGTTGKWDSAVPVAYDKIRIYEIPPGVLVQGENTILVKVQGYFPGLNGIVRGRTEIGPTREIVESLRDEDYRELIFLTGYFTAGSYFLFLFLRRRQNRENLIFGLFIYGFVLRQLIRTELRFEMDISFLEFKRLEFILTYLLFIAFLYFVRVYFELARTKLQKVMDILSLVFSAIMVLLSGHVMLSDDVNQWWTLQSQIGQGIWLLMLVQVIFFQVKAGLSGNRDGYYMLGGMIFVMIGFFADLAVSNGLLNIPPLFSYFFAAFIFSLALILANRFVRLHRRVEDLNANLERKVVDRTEKLNTTLEEVQELKEKQDGDYFLTSLLMNPLGGHWARSDSLDMETLLEQKKKFHFRKWDSEIGGDLVALYDIILRGEKYSVFLNADAMGKSMQGAGGAIVVGTVFKSLVSRTQVVHQASEKSPEQWLNECFQELQSVFLGFDGHMLISAVVGLVHDASGTVYFFNAEHPATVLYEDQKAIHLADIDTDIRKIGIEVPEGAFRVLVHKLLPGQVLIMGSDGRDDLLMGTTEEGQRIINEDENLFLRIVEQAEGQLDGIRDILQSRGELTDDLSLIRLEYLEDAPRTSDPGLPSSIKEHIDAGDYAQAYRELEGIPWDYPSALQAGVWLTGKLKDYNTSAMLARRLVALDPTDSLALFRCSHALKRTGRLEDAIDYGERCRLRLPDHARNLTNLADCYRLKGNHDRAIQLANRALNLDHELEAARQILERTTARV